MNGQTAKRIRKQVESRNPGMYYLLKEEYGEGIFELNIKQIYNKAKRLYKKKPFLNSQVLRMGREIIEKEIEKEKNE